ncbi:hypothetical protein QFC20_007575 [Naganishia adeliensis]|uniref:Uncharacterized protein n=1 Tax=Naganishia adeliensis TaxID=92952 RepID=A0ACC2UYI7_9TREE|nr:hypothetical protein QFC20_007575 [Naganishia adeliensis]
MWWHALVFGLSEEREYGTSQLCFQGQSCDATEQYRNNEQQVATQTKAGTQHGSKGCKRHHDLQQEVVKEGKTNRSGEFRSLYRPFYRWVLLKPNNLIYALPFAKFDSREGMLHKVCIDTGSSISCIDYDYAQQYLSHRPMRSSSNLGLMGVGTNITTGTVKTVLHLVTEDSDDSYEKEITFYIVPRLNTKMIVGNDQLVPMKARIDPEGGKNDIRS